jgi:methanogenic corrinoid protein MtbC1
VEDLQQLFEAIVDGNAGKAKKEKSANIIALSALLTTTMPSMKTTVEGLKEAGVRDAVKIVIVLPINKIALSFKLRAGGSLDKP